MIKIGILAPENHEEITKALLDIFKKNHIIAAVKKNSKNIKRQLDFLERNSIEYAIIIFDKPLIYPITLDILIIDNAPNQRIITYSLIECVSNKTILVYNTDNGYLPKIEHENAIDYGFSSDSSVTVSSIEYLSDYKSFILYIQRPFSNLYDEEITIGEIPIIHINNQDISNHLPAVITALICNIPIYKKSNISNSINPTFWE